MKKNLLTLLIIVASCNVNAQQIKVNWGTEYKQDKKESLSNILYDDGKNIYATVSSYSGGGTVFSKITVTPSLVKFDENMTPIKRRDIAGSEKDLFYHGTFHLANNFFMLTSTYDKHTNTK